MMRNEHIISIVQYRTVQGQVPFDKWLYSLPNTHLQAYILARLDRLRMGNFGDTKSVGSGIQELRIHQGPGYRIYYSWQGRKIVLLLCGGSKGTQKPDIKKARLFWEDYQLRMKK